MLLISKITLGSNLELCLPASFFKAGCKLVSLRCMVFARFCSCQHDCDINYASAVFGRHFSKKNTSWELLVIIASPLPEVLKTLTALNPTI